MWLYLCWLESITASWLSHACHVHSVLFLPMQSSLTNFWRSFTGLVQLIFSYFTLSDSTALIHFIAFSHNLHSAFVLIERHDRHSVHISSFLQTQQLYTAGIPLLEAYLLPMANNQTHNERLSAGPDSYARVFSMEKKNGRLIVWPYAIQTWNALALQRSIFRENCLKVFDLHPLPRSLVSFVAINTWKVRCWVTDTHRYTD